jgi:succinate dehydrogenase hydrophobic anchor subunit
VRAAGPPASDRPGQPAGLSGLLDPDRRRTTGVLTWVTVRVTGLILAVLVLGHFAVTHVVTDVADTGSTFVAERWRSAIVLGLDWLMLAAAVLHGAAGMRGVVVEYAGPRVARFLVAGLVVLSAAMLALGTATILAVILA